MSYSSSLGASPINSPAGSLPSTPRSIQTGFSPFVRNAPVEIYPSASTRSSQNPVCAYASSSFNKSNSFGRPNAYISDEDLFGDDFAPYMKEAPPPPRPAQAWAAMPQPLLPPLQSRRRSSSSKEKKRRTSSSSSKKHIRPQQHQGVNKFA